MIHGRRAPRVSQRKNLNDDAAVLQLVGDADADANDGAGDSSDGAPLEDGSPCWLVLGLGGAEDVLAGHALVSAQDVADLPQEVGGTGSGILVGGALGGVLGGGQRSGGVRGLGVLLCACNCGAGQGDCGSGGQSQCSLAEVVHENIPSLIRGGKWSAEAIT